MAEAEYPVYSSVIFLPILSCLAIILDVPPLAWHFRNSNLAATALVGWVMTFNLFAFVNSLLWSGPDPERWPPGYGICDLEIYVAIAGWTGITTALLCIMRNLAKVLDTKNQVVSRGRDRRLRQGLIDAAICWGPPILQICLFDVVKVYRYYLWGISGCAPAIDTSWVSIVLIYIWPLLIDLGTGYYAVLVIVRLHRYRSEFSRLIHSHNTTRSRFVRLFLLSSLLLLGIIPSQAFVLYINMHFQAVDYSWTRNHDPGLRSQIVRLDTQGDFSSDRWVSIVCGFALFLFFGLGTDALDMYRSWAAKLNPFRFCRKKRKGNNGRSRRSTFCASHHASDGGGTPISPSRSMFSYKTYFSSTTSTTRSNSTTGKSHRHLSKSSILCKSPLAFWRARVDSTNSTTISSTSASSTAPILPLHHHHHHHHHHNHDSHDNTARTPSTATSTAPTIDTAISMTPLSAAIRKASAGTLVEDDNDVDYAATLFSPPVLTNAEMKRGNASGYGTGKVIEGLGIEMGVIAGSRTEV